MVSQKLNRNTLTPFILINVLKLPQFTLLKLENLKTQFFTTLSVTTKQLIFLWRNTILFAVCLQSFKTFKITFWVFPTLKTHQTFLCSSLITHVAYQSQHLTIIWSRWRVIIHACAVLKKDFAVPNSLFTGSLQAT